MSKLQIQLITPEQTLLDQQVDSLTCQTVDGQIEILSGHEPLVAVLRAGELRARALDKTFSLAVAGGFVEVRPGNNVVVLADAAEHAAEIDEQEAREAVQRAAEDMKQYKTTDAAYAAARAVHLHHNVRLSLARKHRSHNKVTSEGILEE